MIRRAPLTDLLLEIIDNRGKTCPTSDVGFPLIATNCVKNSTLYPTFEKVRYVSPETRRSWFRGHPLPGDLIFVTKGSPGQVCMTPSPVSFCIAQDMVAIRADPDTVYPPYLFAALRSEAVQNDIANMHVGTLIPHFKKGDFDKLKIPLPEVTVQSFVGDYYLAMSRKIELNRLMNETLEAMTQAIFRDWFVDFGPTRRKLDGASDPVTIMGGLVTDPERARELAELFPARLGDDGLPEGWTEGDLSDYANLNPETWSTRNHPDQVEYVDLANTKWGVIEATTCYSWPHAPSRARRVVKPGDTIVGTVRPGNGSYSYIAEEGLTASTGFAALRPKRPEFRELTYLAATSRENIERLQYLADGGAYPAVKPELVLSTYLPAVPNSVVSGFSAISAPLISKVEHGKIESRTLAATRDLLLPKLMSGEICLKETGKRHEAAF